MRQAWGPSPPARGSRARPDHQGDGEGSIPACAGEPPRARFIARAVRVHPRLRGGARRSSGRAIGTSGPSPPARGSRDPGVRDRDLAGSIPACAGEPSTEARPRSRSWVHPRLRGGAGAHHAPTPRGVGPSPPARGSPPRGRGSRLASRSIPACAGEPGARVPAALPGSVHPRLRGGASGQIRSGHAEHGPSPPARGSPRFSEKHGLPIGSIPACAGEPRGPSWSPRRGRVHPRLRGGASVGLGDVFPCPGPSPPARGSRGHRHDRRRVVGSIPACAGEPRSTRAQPRRPPVHPRLRGGAARRRAEQHALPGPSPPARGSRARPVARGGAVRSIPACAGEPSARAAGGTRPRVHPRLRGGAASRQPFAEAVRGPSPPARGSHRRDDR